MNHPNREQLVAFVYDELVPTEQAEVGRHVASCGECRDRIASWRDVRAALATWKVDELRPSPPQRWTIPSVPRWAAAAVIFIASGFALARLTAPPAPDIDRLRAELEHNVSTQLDRHADDQRAAQRAFLREVDGRINQIEQERLAAYSGLRKDVETVAMQTQEAFVRLTSAPTSN